MQVAATVTIARRHKPLPGLAAPAHRDIISTLNFNFLTALLKRQASEHTVAVWCCDKII
jgi:hypothetical protein